VLLKKTVKTNIRFMSHHAPLILDIAGTQLTVADRARLKHPLTGGVILFGRNWVNRQQLTQLCADIKAVRNDLLICVDHEGGRVQRFRNDGFTHIPPMAAMDAATASGYVLASELRACGVDFSFTPVLDLDHGESGVIGDRSFHRDPRVATTLAKNVMHGLLLAGMANCGKHFPGHGYVKADSHVDIPVDKRTLQAILGDCALPYQWLTTTLTSVMPAHVIYPKVDALPAGFSPRWLQDILRGQLHFNGAIFSDDLSMEGARRIEGRSVSFAEAGVAALNAGCDLVLLCNQSIGNGHAVDEMLEGLTERLVKNQWHASDASEQRRRALLPKTSPLAWDALMTHPAYLRALDLLP
jgi:beta-N-acetylhexosaminidase